MIARAPHAGCNETTGSVLIEPTGRVRDRFVGGVFTAPPLIAQRVVLEFFNEVQGPAIAADAVVLLRRRHRPEPRVPVRGHVLVGRARDRVPNPSSVDLTASVVGQLVVPDGRVEETAVRAYEPVGHLLQSACQPPVSVMVALLINAAG